MYYDEFGIANSIKIILGHVVIALIYYSWRVVEIVSGKTFGASTKSHYYIMKVFRFLCKSILVNIRYPNPLQANLNVKLQVDLCQNSQQWYFRTKDNYEKKSMKIVANGMKNADCFIDIGSNIGIYAITIAQAFKRKKIIAVEPLNENCMSLGRNIELNSIDNVETINAVVSNSEGNKSTFYPNPINEGGGSTIKRSYYRTGDIFINSDKFRRDNTSFASEFEINSIRIDDIIKSKSVIKIDVEGTEVSVLESGGNVFKQGLVDLIVVEVLNETIDKVTSLLDAYGFDCFTQEDMAVPLKVGARLSWFVGNIICLRRESSDYGCLREQCF